MNEVKRLILSLQQKYSYAMCKIDFDIARNFLQWKLNCDSNSIRIEEDEKRMVYSRLLLVKTKNRFSTLGVEQNVKRGKKERKKRTVNAKL